MSIFYCVCDDDCRYETMTKEQILTAIEQALENGYVPDPDSAVFSKIKELRVGASTRLWVGTEAQFNALDPAPTVGKSLARVGSDGVLYLCSDDSSLDLLNDIAENGMPIELGGTNAKTAEDARANLGAASQTYVDEKVAELNNQKAPVNHTHSLDSLGIIYAETLPATGTEGQICLVPID